MLYLQSKSPFFLPVAAGDDDIIKHTPPSAGNLLVQVPQSSPRVYQLKSHQVGDSNQMLKAPPPPVENGLAASGSP